MLGWEPEGKSSLETIDLFGLLEYLVERDEGWLELGRKSSEYSLKSLNVDLWYYAWRGARVKHEKGL